MFIQLLRLCRRILREHYGPIAVGVVLIKEGRMPLSQLIKSSKQTPRHVREAISVLIQHGIAAHAVSKEGPHMVVFYSISTRNIMRLKRSGLYLALVEERMGKDGLNIFEQIIVNGCMSISQVKSSVSYYSLPQTAQIKFDSAALKLVRERFIVAVTPTDTMTKIDRIMQKEAKELDKLTVPPTAKELIGIRKTIAEDEEERYHSLKVVGIKRKANHVSSDAGQQAKVRIGPDGTATIVDTVPGMDSVAADQVDEVDPNQLFCPYYDRLDVFLRNQQIINYFTDKYNPGAGAVTKSILRVTESRVKTCRDQLSDVVSAAQVIHHIPHDAPLADAVDLGSDMFYENLASANEQKDGTMAVGTLSKAKRAEISHSLLMVLGTDSSHIIRKVDERGAGQYRVNFHRASTLLRNQCINSLVHEKFGSLHARIINVLREGQKLDEKTIAQTAMVPIAICRTKLHELALAGFVDTLEIPRTADRAPSRTFYLWYINEQKQTCSALRLIFHAMTNVIMRLAHEISLRRPLIEKSLRDDVIADPELLTDPERKELATLDSVKLSLEATNVRLDGMMLLLRDIDPSTSDLRLF